jgi:putative methanogenesis marker protein 8
MNPEQLIEKYKHLPDFHLTRIMGSWVVVSQGRVVEVDRTHALQRCPLQSMLSDADIETYAMEKITELKQFTPKREVWRSTFAVPFGTSEMFMVALRKGTIDCAVIVCDGAGTVVTNIPEVVQGIGARMNGVFYTSPIPEVQEKLRSHNSILLDDARIDQMEGLRKAVEAGFTRIAVTVNGRLGQPLRDFRSLEKEAGVSVTIATVCTTGVARARSDEIPVASDLAWSCASCQVRETGVKARLQITEGIPIFVYTSRGIELLAAYSDQCGAEILHGLDPSRQYLLAATGSSTRILLGEIRLALSEVLLPVRSANEPTPLH